MNGKTTAWRDSMRPVRFYLFDVKLMPLMFLWLFCPNRWTSLAVLLAMIVFRLMEGRGYRFHACLRALRRRLAGKRQALYAQRVARFTDFG